MTDRITELEKSIKDRRAEIAELEEALEKAKQEDPEYQLARNLHGMLCVHNHTDGCGWFYEFKNKEDDWVGQTHGHYLNKARKLVHQCSTRGISVDRALEVYKMVKHL